MTTARTESNRPLARACCSEPCWTRLDSSWVPTDQKVGGSSPSERARPRNCRSARWSPASRSALVIVWPHSGRISVGRALVETVGVAVHLAGIEMAVQVKGTPGPVHNSNPVDLETPPGIECVTERLPLICGRGSRGVAQMDTVIAPRIGHAPS